MLAYANIAKRDTVTACLVYPFTLAKWQDLSRRSRTAHRAELGAGGRRVELVLAAVPIGGEIDEVAAKLGESVVSGG